VEQTSQQFIMTTEQLAQAFDTTPKNVLQSFRRHKEDFIEGKDYFLLEGETLKDFDDLNLKASNIEDFNLKLSLDDDLNLKSSKGGARRKYLWTQTGAFMHACFLNTPRAREAFKNMIELAGKPQVGISPEEHATLQEKYKAIFAVAMDSLQVEHMDDASLDYADLEDVYHVLEEAKSILRQLKAEHKNVKAVVASIDRLEKKITTLSALVEHTEEQIEEADPKFIAQEQIKRIVLTDGILALPSPVLPQIEAPKTAD
jgi:hypothetical protein